jgi:putative spermidine/putrescine transport system substrate-binding protein
MNRREVLTGVAAFGTAAFSGLNGSYAQTADLVFNGAGGSWQDNARQAWLEPFSKKTGIKITDTSPFDLGKLSTMVRTNTVAWDVTDCPTQFVPITMKNNLLEPIDYSIVDRGTLSPENYGAQFVAYGVYTANVVYDRRRLMQGDRPSSWKDFFDLERFPGPRTLRNQPFVALEAALLADGVPASQLYPLDVDRAFRKLDRIKGQIRWWSNAQQSVQFIANGEVVMGISFPSRAFAARREGVPLEVVWNEGLFARNRLVVPKGGRNKAEAMKLINFIIQPEQQAGFANANRSAPVNLAAFPMIEPGVAEELATNPKFYDKLIALDELGYWAEHGDALNKRFQNWLVA